MRIAFFLFFLFSLPHLYGQVWKSRVQPQVNIGDTTQTHQVILLDYSRLLGIVMEIRSDSLTLRVATLPEPLRLPTRQMRYVGLSTAPSRRGRSAPGRAPLGDLTLVRTALPYPSEREFRTVMLLYNSVNWTLNEHFQLGVGLAGPLGILLNQRYRTSVRPWLHLGVSNEIVVAPLIAFGDDRLPFAGDLTGLLTVGTSEQFFTAGAGMFYLSDNPSSPIPNFRAGLGTRLGRPTHLYGELVAYVDERIGEVGLLPSLNLSLARRSHRWSFGIMSYFIDDDFTTPAPIPYVSYALYF
jgi:hypothetical protein